MCCFSRPVQSVTATRIFARPAEEGRQFLVYSMTLKANEDLAMVLPLPAKEGAGEKAVTFIDLQGYANFFDDLERGFDLRDYLKSRSASVAPAKTKLEVVQVGNFEASYVPTVKDFSRLDERFRLPPGTWEALPAYRKYSFAVFKLKPGAVTIHPMAFSFPRADTASLFFPTVHIHDGKVHAKVAFDHSLYCQGGSEEEFAMHGWNESPTLVKSFVKVDKAKGLVDGERHCYRKQLKGSLPNQDTRLARA